MKTKSTPMAEDIMNRHVKTVSPDMPLSEVVTFLLKHRVSNVPVVKKEGDDRVLLGFLSEGDCLEFLANELFYGNPSPQQTAETMMKKHPVCVSSDADVFALTSIFTNHHYRHLPVVDGLNLIGIVSRRDVIEALDQYYRDWTRSSSRERLPVDLHKIMNLRFLVSN